MEAINQKKEERPLCWKRKEKSWFVDSFNRSL